jgi:hypothetical protein
VRLADRGVGEWVHQTAMREVRFKNVAQAQDPTMCFRMPRKSRLVGNRAAESHGGASPWFASASTFGWRVCVLLLTRAAWCGDDPGVMCRWRAVVVRAP